MAGRAGAREKPREDMLADLAALQGTLVAFKLYQANTTYNVVVEQVELLDTEPATGRALPMASIRVTARVVVDTP